MAINYLAKTFTSAEADTNTIRIPKGKFSFSFKLVSGTATVQLQRYSAEIDSWLAVFNPNVSSASMTASDTLTGDEPMRGGALYRTECTVFGSGSSKTLIAW